MSGVLEGFAGPGGWSEALTKLGRVGVGGFDNDVDTCATGEAASHRRYRRRIERITTDELQSWTGFDGIVMSAPCPAFSVGGDHGGRQDTARLMEVADPGLDRLTPLVVPQAGWTDPSSALILEPLRWAQAMRPGWVALEQVPRAAPLFWRFAHILRRWGYATAVFDVNAVRYGVPQSRERLFLLASLDRQVSPPAYTHREFNLRKPVVEDWLPQWVSMRDVCGFDADTLVGAARPADRMGPVDAILLDGEWKRRRDLRTVTQPSKTITGKSGFWWRWLPIDNSDEYTKAEQLTIDETAALQTFRRGYPWQGSKRSISQQIGNAVPPLLAEVMLRQVLPTTEGRPPR